MDAKNGATNHRRSRWIVQAEINANDMAEMTSSPPPPPPTPLTDEKTNTTQPLSDDVMASTWLQVLFVSLYAVVFLLGVSGNSLVVYVIYRNKSLQTTTNVFIANLAVSDIMMCLLAVPFTPISGLLSDWFFGKVSDSLETMAPYKFITYLLTYLYRVRKKYPLRVFCRFLSNRSNLQSKIVPTYLVILCAHDVLSRIN